MAFELKWGALDLHIGAQNRTSAPDATNVPAQPDNAAEVAENGHRPVISGGGEHSLLSNEDFKQLGDVLESIVLPVSAERSTVPGHTTLFQALQGLAIVQPDFQLELIGSIENLALYNPEVSNAIENIVMANTPHKIYFPDNVPQAQARAMMARLKERRDNWYQHSYGIHGFINDLLVQAAISGAVSFECVPNTQLNGIDYITLVSPKWIHFNYDGVTGKYTPMQKIPTNSPYMGPRIQGQFKKLNPATYKYMTLRRVGDSPYPVPPFLAALESILIQKDMITNLKNISAKLGLLGFLRVLLNKPVRRQGESDDGYSARLKQELDKNLTEIKKGFLNGFMAGYAHTPNNVASTPGQQGKAGGSNEAINSIDLQPTISNATGAEKVVEVVNKRVQLGMKQDSAMAGSGSTVTETFGRVILAKMTAQFGSYQWLSCKSLDFAYVLDLNLGGYRIPFVESEFEAVMLGDKERDENAYALKIANAEALYQGGVIEQDEKAQMLGYDEAALPEPRQAPAVPGATPAGAGGAAPAKKPEKKAPPSNPSPDSTGAKTKEKKAAARFNWEPAWRALGGTLREFEYCSDHLCGAGHEHEALESFASGDEEPFWADYRSESERIYLNAVRETVGKVAAELRKIDAGVDAAMVESLIMYHIYTGWDKAFTAKERNVIHKFVNEAYRFFRADTNPLKGVDEIPDVVFDLTDLRVIEFFRNSDELYLGKFITDQDTRRRLTSWIKEQYIDNAIPIGKDSPGLGLFEREFTGVLTGEKWKVRRIVDTTVARLRNAGAVSYLKQAKITNFTIAGVSDDLQCPYCASLQGAIFETDIEYRKLERVVNSAPESTPTISPFVTAVGLTPDNIKEMSWKEVQMRGIGAPPYHSHCRDTVVAELQ